MKRNYKKAESLTLIKKKSIGNMCKGGYFGFDDSCILYAIHRSVHILEIQL